MRRGTHTHTHCRRDLRRKRHARMCMQPQPRRPVSGIQGRRKGCRQERLAKQNARRHAPWDGGRHLWGRGAGFQLTTRASAGDGGVCFRWDADACARSRRRRGARACVKLCGRAATDACTSVPWARTQRPCAPPLTLVCAHAMMRHGAARLAAWSWLQALVDGGHSRETKALLVHGGLAAFFYLFYRKCALAPHMFCPAHTHCQPCAHVPCQECRERGAPRSGAALRSLASLAARACCCCPLDASESAAPGSGPCASGSTGATT